MVALPETWHWDWFGNLRVFALVDIPLKGLPRGFYERQSSFSCRMHHAGYGGEECGLVVMLSGNQLELGRREGGVEMGQDGASGPFHACATI